MDSGRLSLTEAIEKGRLDDFVAQEEAAVVTTIDASEFDLLIGAAFKPRQSADRTSHSPSPRGSHGK